MSPSTDPAEVGELAARIERRDGAPPLSDQALSRIGSPAVTHLEARDGDRLVGYAQLDGTNLELAADPDHLDELFRAAERVRPDIEVWSHGHRSPVAGVARSRGYATTRVLLQLRRPASPIPPSPVELPDGVVIRAFVPGQDEQDWLEVNAAAFSAHPEQGRVGLSDLLARERTDWFDPAGFLLAVQGNALLGFHWTKVHPDGSGEVYVLGIAPAAQGMGLGKALLNAGLAHLGPRPILLYVEETNDAARRLYEKAGFVEFDRDIQLQSPARLHRD